MLNVDLVKVLVSVRCKVNKKILDGSQYLQQLRAQTCIFMIQCLSLKKSGTDRLIRIRFSLQGHFYIIYSSTSIWQQSWDQNGLLLCKCCYKPLCLLNPECRYIIAHHTVTAQIQIKRVNSS